MANLLTAAEIAQIQAGFKDTLDTYSNTNITIRVTNDLSLSPFNEGTGLPYTDYTFLAHVEYNNGSASKEDTNFAGTWDDNEVRAFVHLDYVIAAGLIVNGLPNFSQNSTKMIILGAIGRSEFKVTKLSVDGSIFNPQIFMMVYGKREAVEAR